MSTKKSTGGAATNRGIWYQAIWCVLSTTSARIVRTNASDSKDNHSLQIVLEPQGGDAWLERPSGRRVIQLKTLSSGTWSIKNVVEEVFPDLYRAIDMDYQKDISYELITEGRIGKWSLVLDFFNSLNSSIGSSSTASEFNTAYELLDNNKKLKFGGSSGVFWRSACTKRTLFDRIVAYLRTLQPAKNDTIDVTRRKTWHMLARFRCNCSVSDEIIRNKLFRELLPVVDYQEDIPNKIDAMVGWMIKKSSVNGTLITAGELFKSQDLKYVLPIDKWETMNERCRSLCIRKIELCGYRSEWDVRFSRENRNAELGFAPFVVVCGESGLGKTWLLFAQTQINDGLASVLIDSKDDSEVDLQRAANQVWRNALSHDYELPLQNIARRRADVLARSKQELWLRICLDKLTSPSAARELLSNPVEDWGVQLIVACNEQATQVFEEYQRDHQQRVQIIYLNRFSPVERDKYLSIRLGDTWADLPSDIRQLIRKPQLADMYCRLHEEIGNWRPNNEYELIDEYWNRLSHFDSSCLDKLAISLCFDAHYPWYVGQLKIAEIDEEAMVRMISNGWLRSSSGRRYEVPHARLLSFAVAHGLSTSHREGSLPDETIADLLRRMLQDHPICEKFSFGYVPMDWFFLKLKDDSTSADRVLKLVEEGLNYSQREVLLRRLLPTIGVAVGGLLINRLVRLAAVGNWYEAKPVIVGLSTIPTRELRESIKELLADGRPLIHRAALMLLAERPIPEVLDKVWQVHIDMQSNPEKYFSDDTPSDSKSTIYLYRESYDALLECAKLDSDWVVTAIRRADFEAEPVHDLAYITARLGDGGKTWQTCKAELFDKVSSDKRRCLAINIGTWKDRSELHHLISWINNDADFLGPSALRALAQIDPKQAAEKMLALPERLQYFCRNWHLPRMLLIAPHETRDQFHTLVQKSKDPLTSSFVFQGFENEMDGLTLDILLGALSDSLVIVIDKSKLDRGKEKSELASEINSLFRPLDMLASIGRRDLLNIFESRQGTLLETCLEQLLTELIGPRCGVWVDNLTREPAMKVLLKIGGDGFGRVVDTFLDAETKYGIIDALDESFKSPNRNTRARLLQIALSDELWDEFPLLQNQSMRALAVIGDGDGVLSSALHIGIKISHNIADYLSPNAYTSDEAIEQALSVIKKRDIRKLPGALIGLGMLGVHRAKDDIVAILRNPPDSESKIAAIIALGRLGKHANEAVEFIRDCLVDKHTRHVSVAALERIGSTQAHRYLFDSLTNSWDMSLAIWLTQFEELSTQIICSISRQLKSIEESTHHFFMSDLNVFLARANDGILAEILPKLEVVNNHLRELAFACESSFWIVGSKASAIRGLAATDSNDAFLAARNALVNVDAHDRQLYPPLLSKINAESARELYHKLAATEKNKAVLWSMAHTMELTDVPWMLEQLSASASSSSTRLAACRSTVGKTSADESVQKKLLEMLSDSDDDVASVAEQSLYLIRQQKRASDLANELDMNGHNVCLKHWAIVDAALEIGHCGYKGTQWPVWEKKFANTKAFKATPALGLTLHKRMIDKREKSLRDADR